MAAFNEHLRDFAGRLIVYRLHFYTHFGIQLCKSILAFGLFASTASIALARLEDPRMWPAGGSGVSSGVRHR